MKTTIDKEFFEKWKDEGVAMWCKKEEYAKEFCRLMDENNLTWNTGESYLKDNYWDDCTIETAYSFNIGEYCCKEWCRNEGYTILDFEDYIINNDLEQYEKLFKDIKKLNTALTKAVVETLLKDNVVEEKEINSLPAHYNIAGIDVMDFIIATCEHNKTNQRETFYLANALKYLIRYKNKNGLEDLKKAKDYLNRLIEYTTIENLPFYDVNGQGD